MDNIDLQNLIYTRRKKGKELNHDEVDHNFEQLDKALEDLRPLKELQSEYAKLPQILEDNKTAIRIELNSKIAKSEKDSGSALENSASAVKKIDDALKGQEVSRNQIDAVVNEYVPDMKGAPNALLEAIRHSSSNGVKASSADYGVVKFVEAGRYTSVRDSKSLAINPAVLEEAIEDNHQDKKFGPASRCGVQTKEGVFEYRDIFEYKKGPTLATYSELDAIRQDVESVKKGLNGDASKQRLQKNGFFTIGQNLVIQWGEETFEFYQGMRRVPQIDFPTRFNSEVFYLSATDIATEEEVNMFHDKLTFPPESTPLKIFSDPNRPLDTAHVVAKIPSNSSEKKTIRLKWLAIGV